MEAKGLLYVVERIKTKIILSLGYRGSSGSAAEHFSAAGSNAMSAGFSPGLYS